MTLKLSHDELVLLKHGMLMYKYVRYYGMAKPDLCGDNKKVFDTVDRKIIAVLEAARDGPRTQQVGVDLASEEMNLLVRVIEADMKQCDKGNTESSAVDYRVNFGTERKDVESLLATLLSYSK